MFTNFNLATEIEHIIGRELCVEIKGIGRFLIILKEQYDIYECLRGERERLLVRFGVTFLKFGKSYHGVI